MTQGQKKRREHPGQRKRVKNGNLCPVIQSFVWSVWEVSLAHALRLPAEILVSQLSFSSALIFIKSGGWEGSDLICENNHSGCCQVKAGCGKVPAKTGWPLDTLLWRPRLTPGRLASWALREASPDTSGSWPCMQQQTHQATQGNMPLREPIIPYQTLALSLSLDPKAGHRQSPVMLPTTWSSLAY